MPDPTPQQMPPPMGGAQQAPAQMPPPASPTFPQPPNSAVQQSAPAAASVEEIEQVVETIIDERWSEVTENIKKVITWKNAMDEKFVKMDEDIKNLKGDFNELYKAIVGKVGDYDKNILKVDTELKAMEKVFSQVLPAFTANVNELARIAEDMRFSGSKSKSHKEKQEDKKT